jgi:hypothetical protein
VPRIRIIAMLIGLALALIGPTNVSAGTALHAHVSQTTSTNALCNESFEEDITQNNCWVSRGFGPSDTPTGGGHTGEGFGRLCAPSWPGECNAELAQLVIIPNALTGVSLSGWLKGSTTDAVNDCSSFAGLGFHETGDPASVEAKLCEDDLTADWQQITLGSDALQWLQARAGEDVWAVVLGYSDNNTETPPDGDYFADDITLEFETTPAVVTSERSISLTLRRHLKAKGTLSLVDGGPNKCVIAAPVKVQKKTSTGWKKVGSGTTDGVGAFKVVIPDKPGTYRAVAAKLTFNDSNVCAKATSLSRKHSH